MPDALLACALLATSALMFPRILVEIGAIHPALLKELALPFAATTLVYLGGTLFHALRGGRASQEAPDEPGLRNPFELLPAMRFAALLSAILLLVEVGRRLFGDAGIYAVALLSGLADVDAITLSLARAARGELDPGVASRGIALAALSNSLVKAGLVVLVGGKRLALQTLPFSLAGLLVGALLILLGGAGETPEHRWTNATATAWRPASTCAATGCNGRVFEDRTRTRVRQGGSGDHGGARGGDASALD